MDNDISCSPSNKQHVYEVVVPPSAYGRRRQSPGKAFDDKAPKGPSSTTISLAPKLNIPFQKRKTAQNNLRVDLKNETTFHPVGGGVPTGASRLLAPPKAVGAAAKREGHVGTNNGLRPLLAPTRGVGSRFAAADRGKAPVGSTCGAAEGGMILAPGKRVQILTNIKLLSNDITSNLQKINMTMDQNNITGDFFVIINNTDKIKHMYEIDGCSKIKDVIMPGKYKRVPTGIRATFLRPPTINVMSGLSSRAPSDSLGYIKCDFNSGKIYIVISNIHLIDYEITCSKNNMDENIIL
jgi:hypothetical protein